MNERPITADTTEAVELIRSLVFTYIDHPDDLAITVRDFGDQVYFVMQGHSDDYRRLVGAKGAHVASLEFIVKQMGRARQVVHNLRLLDPEPALRRDGYPSETAEAYDTGPMAELLKSLFLACGLDEVKIVTTQEGEPRDRPLSFKFSVFTRTQDDYESITISPPRARNELSVMSALTFLLNAAGQRAGVRFNLVAVQP